MNDKTWGVVDYPAWLWDCGAARAAEQSFRLSHDGSIQSTKYNTCLTVESSELGANVVCARLLFLIPQ